MGEVVRLRKSLCGIDYRWLWLLLPPLLRLSLLDDRLPWSECDDDEEDRGAAT